MLALAACCGTVVAQAPPTAQRFGTAPVHLYRDAGHRAFALQLPGPVDTTLARHYVTAAEFEALARLGATLAFLPDDGNAQDGGPCTRSPLPPALDIAFVEGVVFGNVARCADTRPHGATTQEVAFVMFSSGYRGQAAHTVVMARFRNALHGLGIYFGDTSAIPCADGRDAAHNTRIEAWSQWAGRGPAPGPYWTSTGPRHDETCGAPLEDGWSPASGAVAAAYAMHVSAGDDLRVRYEVARREGGAWVPHTPPLVRDMHDAKWAAGPGVLDPSASGLLIGSTGPLGASAGTPWVVAIRDLAVTWTPGWTDVSRVAAVEYHHAGLDHYFVTAAPAEIGDLDGGVHRGWRRTGQRFLVGPPGAGRGEPVCRFYGMPAAGLDSHFYSAHRGECDDVARRLGAAWSLEGQAVFRADLPDIVSGACPAGTQPLHRLWNGRRDSNHRYATDPGVRAAMLAQGFVAEGYGPEGVAMCVPLR